MTFTRTRNITNYVAIKELSESNTVYSISALCNFASITRAAYYKWLNHVNSDNDASKAEYSDYQSAVARWEQQTGNEAESDSFRTRLQRKQMEVKERENNRQSHHYRSDRGGR